MADDWITPKDDWVTPPSDHPTTPGGGWRAVGKGLMHGAGNIFYGAAQTGAHMGPDEGGAAFADPADLAARQQTVDKVVQERQKAYTGDADVKAHPYLAGTGNIAGEIAATSPLMLIPGAGEAGLGARLGLAAGQGALAGSLQPVTSGDFAKGKGKQVLAGAAGGAGGEAVLGTAARVVAPKVSSAVRKLAESGVQMTPGQLGVGGGIFGQSVRRLEEGLKSFPVLGNFIRAGEHRSIEDYNRAVINQTLEPVGASLPKNTQIGHDAVRFAQEKLDEAYSGLLRDPNVRFHADGTFSDNINSLRELAAELPPAQQAQFENVLKNRLLKRLGAEATRDPTHRTMVEHGLITGQMDGQTYKQVEGELGQFASNYMKSSDAAQRDLGNAVAQLRAELHDSLERQNPAMAGQLRAVNRAYAMLTRVEDAAGRRGASDGVFRPTDMLQAVKAGDRSRRKRAFAAGDALMQPFAEIGQKVLPGKMPDSGTTERGALLFGIGELVSHLFHSPEAGLALAAPILASPLYTRPVSSAIQRYMTSGTGRQAFGQAIGDIAHYVDPALGVIAGGQVPASSMTYSAPASFAPPQQ